jgi:MYXO-CTERM domain-containing protein
VFVRSIAINRIISVLFVLSMGACGNLGGCGACGAAQPLPGGILPPNQTIEGGAQVRVTPAGFNKLTSILPGALNSQLGGGFCLPHGSTGYTLGTGADWCDTNNGGCAPGCKVNVGINNGGFALSVTNQNTLNIQLSTSVSTSVHLSGSVLGIGASCTITATSNNLNGNIDIALGVRPDNGELDIHLASINNFHLGMSFSGCSLLSDVANLVSDLVDSVLGQFLVGLLTPAIDSLVQSILPHPLGIAGLLDVGQLLEGVSPGTTASMEARLVPGGYANLVGNGLSLGVITGLNSDEDPTTRTGVRPDGVQYASEPNKCVPPLPISDYGAAPYSLPSVARSALNGNTFALAPADEFNGSPDGSSDIIMGLSQTMLDLAGHHAVTSGAMCLGVGTSFIKQLNVSTIGILVPSLADLASDSGNDPLLLVTRPQRALDFTIGDNTASSPALTIGISHLEVDFYAFLFERYIRAFTLDLTLNVGVNLTFMPAANGMPATVQPMLTGLSASSVQLKVLNSEFVKETPQHLEMVLPSVFDLVTPLLGNLPPINVPTFAGFSLDNLAIRHVTTSQDDFLALTASLGPGSFARELAQHDSFAAQAVADLDAGIGPVAAASTGSARLVNVHTPVPEKIRGALLQQKDGELPSVTFDTDRYDSRGRELEWSWNINGGLWRPFTTASPLVISDRAFAWQGKYTIGLMSRVKGDYKTTTLGGTFPVVIDSVGPKVFTDKVKVDGDQISVPVWDAISGHNVMIGFGKKGDAAPATDWVPYESATLAKETAQTLADNSGEVAVFAKDELGNQTIAFILPFHGQSGGAGCACQTGSAPTSGSLVLFGIVGLGLARGRRRRIFRSRLVKNVGLWILGSALLSIFPGCSCSKNAAQACEMDSDCGECPKGQLPFCIDNTCVCSDDIPAGRIGPYSDVATGADGSVWVSAYASSHGDLVVTKATGGRVPDEAWEWVDGVPDGPVVVPNSMIRGGIEDDGPDVGMYTSIQVAPDGTPMVTYFDRDNSSLKFAAKVGGVWQKHVVDTGGGTVDNGALVGMYTSLTLRSDDGRPGVAYVAHVADANGGHAEVRYAAAQVPVPTSSADWQTWVVDMAPLPPTDPNNPNIYPLPEGLGLFVESARDPRNQAPVVVYYDRTNGDLKLARFNTQTGQFDTPKILDGTMADDGWSPTVAVDMNGVAHVAYVDATADDLKYITDEANATPEIVDDGYRIVGTTVDGLPKPEYHFVGDDAGIVLPAGGQPYVVYQDSTTQEMLLAQRMDNGMWVHTSVAGATDPWPGAYGFFASDALLPSEIVMSTWVIDQPTDDNWVEVLTRPTSIQ